MVISGVEVYPVNVTWLSDKEPVYIEFDDDSPFNSQWGIVDTKRRATIHKDFVISFSDKCRYYGLHELEEADFCEEKGVIVNF